MSPTAEMSQENSQDVFVSLLLGTTDGSAAAEMADTLQSTSTGGAERETEKSSAIEDS